MKQLAYLNKYFWKYRGRLLMGFMLIAIGNIFSVYAPVVVRDGIDFLADALRVKKDLETDQILQAPSSFQHIASWMGSSASDITLNSSNYADTVVRMGLLLALLYLVMFIVKGVFLFYQRQALIVMSRHIEYDLKNEVYNKYQDLDAAFYKRNRTGDLMNRISEDVNRVRMYTGPAVMYTLNLIVMVVMCTVVMLQIDVELTLYTLSPLPFMMLAIYYVSQTINKKSELVQQQQSRLSAMVQETISGIRVLRAFHREGHYSTSFTDESATYRGKQLSLVRIDALFMPVIVILVGLSTILTVYVGAHKVMAGEISPGVIVQFVFYVNILTWPFAVVGWVTSLVQKAEASQGRINEFLQTRPDIQSPTKPVAFSAGTIQFEHVSLIYDDSGVKALDDVSFTIEKGKTLGVIGRTGSGKSTIAQLMPRMMDPTSGKITIDGKELSTVSLSELRNQIGYVTQEVFLFSDSIRNNIRFGCDPSEEDIIEAARRADVHNNIMAFPDGYDTLLGERGINLSGGQKQRISIARAIAKNPDILIFDDCLSAVDTQTEDRIIKGLRKVMQDKTSIVIAHRISTIKDADQIIFLDQGKVMARGTHEELLAQDGAYAALYRKQLLEEADPKV
jgi:ATP-binding cassette subfamily B multidrug efflux pump